jgi:tetratricopeptide (TPR) repeat protein
VIVLLVRIKLPKGWLIKRRSVPPPMDTKELKCLQCDYKIAADSKFCPKCRVVILRRYCQSCKRLVPDHTQFCPYCSASSKDKRKQRDLKYPTNIAMIVGLIVLTVVLWPKEKQTEIRKHLTDPAAGVRLNLKGHSLIQQGRYHEAVSLLYQAIKSFPEDSNMMEYFFAQYNLGHSLRRIGKSEEAIPYLERCVAYDRHNQKFIRELEAARRDLQRKENY